MLPPGQEAHRSQLLNIALFFPDSSAPKICRGGGWPSYHAQCVWSIYQSKHSCHYKGPSTLPSVGGSLLLLFSCSFVSSFLRPCELQHAGFPVLHHLLQCSLLKFMSIELVMLCNHLILCYLLLLLPSIFPSIRVFSNELALCIKWTSISFTISPFSECSGSISFWMDGWQQMDVWLDGCFVEWVWWMNNGRSIDG